MSRPRTSAGGVGPAPEWRLPASAAGRSTDLLAIGSLLAEQVVNVERHPVPGAQDSVPIRSMASGAGGGAANVAVHGAWAGGRTAVAGVTGDGPRARAVLEALAAAGVDTDAVAIRAGADADLLVLLCDAAGGWTALEHLDPALRIAMEDLPPVRRFADAAWLHVDGYAHHTAGTPAIVDEALRRARAAGCAVSVDAAVPSSQADPEFVRSVFARADIAFANRAEAAALTGRAGDDAADALLALGPSVVILKDGLAGSVVATREGRRRVNAREVDVVDTLAAGDAFAAATLVALARGLPLVEAVERGAAAGALACEGAGSQGRPYAPADIEALLARATRAAAGPRESPEAGGDTRGVGGDHADGPEAAGTVPGSRRHRFLGSVQEPVPRYVFVPGSESRVRRLAARFDHPRTLAHDDDVLLVAGTVGGVAVAACSTGIGGLGVSQVVEALGARGASTFIRVGVTGALQARIGTGDLVVASGAVRLDGTSDAYADPAYPAAADPWVMAGLVAAAREAGVPVHVGVGGTSSSFYAGEGIPAAGGFVSASMAGIEDELRAAGVLDWDTETASLFVVARLRGWRAGRMNVVVDDRETGRYNPVGEGRAIEVALRAVALLAAWDAAGRTGRRWPEPGR